MKKFLFFISIVLLPLLGHSQTVSGNQTKLPDILPNSSVSTPHRSNNRHYMLNRRLGRGVRNRTQRRRQHRRNFRQRPRLGRLN